MLILQLNPTIPKILSIISLYCIKILAIVLKQSRITIYMQ
jgi:hypothetical protein